MNDGLFVRSIDSLKGSHLPKSVLLGIAVVLVMVAVAAGRLLLDTATAKTYEVVQPSQAAAIGEEAVAETEKAQVRVHVAGAVAQPGVYMLAEGSCVADAVEAAGGFKEGAARDAVNLARDLKAGEQVVIPSEESMDSVAGIASLGSDANNLVNINSASESDLQSLPGIGAQTAKKIVAERERNGPFESVEDLKRVSGIGDKKLETIETLVTV